MLGHIFFIRPIKLRHHSSSPISLECERKVSVKYKKKCFGESTPSHKMWIRGEFRLNRFERERNPEQEKWNPRNVDCWMIYQTKQIFHCEEITKMTHIYASYLWVLKGLTKIYPLWFIIYEFRIFQTFSIFFFKMNQSLFLLPSENCNSWIQVQNTFFLRQKSVVKAFVRDLNPSHEKLLYVQCKV